MNVPYKVRLMPLLITVPVYFLQNLYIYCLRQHFTVLLNFPSTNPFFLRTHDEIDPGSLLTVGLLSILIPKRDLSSHKKVSDLLVNRYPVSPNP